jgi:hypothetical protein
MRADKAPLSAILPCAPNTAGANNDRTPSAGLSGIFHGAVPQNICRNICAAGAAERVGHSQWLTFCNLLFSQSLCFGVAGNSFGRCCLSSISMSTGGLPACLRDVRRDTASVVGHSQDCGPNFSDISRIHPCDNDFIA